MVTDSQQLLLRSSGDAHHLPGHPARFSAVRVPHPASLPNSRLKLHMTTSLRNLFLEAQGSPGPSSLPRLHQALCRKQALAKRLRCPLARPRTCRFPRRGQPSGREQFALCGREHLQLGRPAAQLLPILRQGKEAWLCDRRHMLQGSSRTRLHNLYSR